MYKAIIPLIIKFLRPSYTLLIGTLLLFTLDSHAQLCKGSLGDPVVKIDFGSGTAVHSGALTGTTSYTYSSADFPSDGYYTVENTTAGAGNVWWSTTDHTSQAGGTTGGYMMVVNSSVSKTDYFYKSTVSGLCPGTTFEFAAWVVNLLRSSDISPPNITFTISTTTGTVLGTYTTGSIPLTPSGPVWKQFGTYFTTPAGVTDVVIQMTNNSNGGAPANDLALDDITFRPCGPTLVSTFSGTITGSTSSTCAGGGASYTITDNPSTGYTNPAYQWQVNSGSGWTNITGATATTYTFTQPTTAGTYQYRIVSAEADNISSTACQVASNIVTLTVTGSPTAAFSFSSTSCLSDPVVFTDKSPTASPAITSWLWDFGDGHTSTQQNPSYSYTTPGDYVVKLTVTNSSGCSATSATQIVHINAKPVAAFMYSTPSCAGQVVVFTDKSTSADGSIAKWVWNFGDQSAADTETSNQAVSHTYTTDGTYTATLQVTTASGCVSTIASQTIVIHPLPVADFVLPDVCLSDAYAQFTDASTITDGTQSSFTYLWNFGDGTYATVANPNTSTLQSPKHRYSKAADYTVTLTVTSQNGCVSVVKSKKFTVNGAVPVAGFTVMNSASLCSSDPVTIDASASSVDFGNVTKMVFYYDYDRDQTNSSTYLYDSGQIPADKIFYHTYPLFNTPLTQNFHIRLVVYSGGSCSAVYDNNITIHANPIVQLGAIGPLCQEDGAVQISQALNGFTGTAVFSGTGVTSGGLFDPSVSGPGTFTINYAFTAQNGCTFSTSEQVTVYATPVITLTSKLTVLEGGQITLPATATGGAGDVLSYQWSPATGLSSSTVLNPSASPSSDTPYTLKVTSDKGCMATAQTTVSVLKTPVIPNTFTPNGDSTNDTWEIKYLNSYPNCTVDVFNRYGLKVFSSIGYPANWDGRYNGGDLPVGTYYYIINPKNGRSRMTGSITIIR